MLDLNQDFGDLILSLECWDAYNANAALKYPFTTIVQSSGFGKNRLLYELASKMQQKEPMRALYACMRPKETSSGIPNATPQLNAFFFPRDFTAESFALSLYAALEYAMSNWETVGLEWIGLFSRLSKTRVQSGISSTDKRPSKAGDSQTASNLPSTRFRDASRNSQRRSTLANFH